MEYNNVEYFTYFHWLKSVLRYPGYEHYDLLIEKLFCIEFYPILKRDENRMDDGLYLRNDFKYYKGHEDIEFPYRPVSVLEVLIALSGRMDGGVGISIINDRLESASWFWSFIENLGLAEYDNKNFDERGVEMKCRIFIEREYSFDGSGGLFPLKHPKIDQRKVEIWEQAQAYLIENFGVYDFE